MDEQVDDALKHYQTALKLHAQGPRSFDEAADAYDALFECEIFKYPESKTEYDRTVTRPDSQLVLESSFPAGLDLVGIDGDVGSSLPQALYLAYKNHGQFLLDRIKHRARTSTVGGAAAFDEPDMIDDSSRALEDFTAALDRDPSDAELWRRTARVAAFLKSARISRYSLEAAIELDDDPAVVEVEPPSVAEWFAGEQLKRQLETLSDDVAMSHPIMKPFLDRKLPRVFERSLDPAPFLPDPTKSVAVSRPTTQDTTNPRPVIDVPSLSWAELGLEIVNYIEEHGLSGQTLSIQLPDVPDPSQDEQMEIDKQLQDVVELAKPEGKTEGRSAQESPEKATEGNATAAEPKPSVAEAPNGSENPPAKERSISLPSRKRSQSAAGLPDAAEDENGDTKRSKRTRRRETAVEEVMDPSTLLATRLQPFQAADQNLFQTTKNILENLDITERGTLDRIAEILDTCASEERTAKINNPATVDLRDSITSFDVDNANILLNKKASPQLGLSAFLEHTKSSSQLVSESATFDEADGLKAFVDRINEEWHTIHDVAYEWTKAVADTYTTFKWSDQMKTAVTQVIDSLDDVLFDRVAYELNHDQAGSSTGTAAADIISMAQMLFELHLDVYQRIAGPNSVVEPASREETKRRLARWMSLAAEAIRSHPDAADESITFRFLWASVFSTTLFDGVARDHTLACWNSLRDDLAAAGHDDIALPNNTVMPEISAAAADREISKLTTMDFFLGLFQEDMGDPVSVIDTLEPVLNPDSVYVGGGGANDTDPSAESGENQGKDKMAITECASQGLCDLWKFLENSSTELRLFLWAKLGEAYGKIEYTTKQFSCYFRGIEMVVADFDRDVYVNTPQDARRTLFVTMLKSLDDLLIESLSLALNDNSAFDIIDEAHLQSTSSALAKLSCMLHVAAMLEDEIRIGMTPAPSSTSVFTSYLTKLRDMQVRAWSLQYTVLKVGITQNKTVFPKPENDLADYLAAVHQVLGLRKCCKASNKIFLKMMRVELLKQKNIENWEDYLGQVLYDLHGLKLGVGIWEVQDHGCPPEKLEKKQAMALVEKIAVLASRMSMKDLLKSDLKNAIDHMQQAIGSTKSTPQMIHNLRNFTEYLKKPIHPLRLYQALTGNVALDAVTVNTAESALAKHGWFFLLGMIALTKFKGVDLNRRQTPGATDDLRIGATFLRLQLQFTPDRWDAWFRLAECFDYELDEAVLWTADKMNKDRAELVKFQRNAIHCYTLALSHSLTWDPELSTVGSPEDNEEALCELYHKFGMRLYASSREPFAMEPFQHADQERFFIENMGAGTYKKVLHEQMTDYKVWKYAAGLFRRAMDLKPKDWKNPFMLAKCLWKMYQKPMETLDQKDSISRPTVQTVIRALEKTVEVVSLLPKPRHGQDPILEPHYKILSVVHKLVMRGDLSAPEGANILQRQPYAQSGVNLNMEDGDDWESYVIKSVRHLRDKDKSNWQHRLVIRHARILFDNDGSSSDEETSSGGNGSGGYVAAKAAFTVLREGMFTKTMVMNVWKCDAERPGRHHVYTERYVRLMVKILFVMNDRTNMEALLRRLRKKGADFYHFNDMWQSCVMAYLKLIRQSYRIPLTEDDAFKNVSQEEFDIGAERVNEWVASPEAQDHHVLSALKDAIELKKLNSNLMKATPIDDLISDCYSLIYTEVGPPPASSEPGKVEDFLGGLRAGLSRLDGTLTPSEADRESTTLGSLRAPSEQPEKMEKQLSSTGDPAPKSRKPPGVRKPDILRKADQAVLRAAEGPAKPASANGTGSKSRPGSMSGGKNSTPNAEAEEDGESEAGDETAAQAGDEDVEMKDGDAGEEAVVEDGDSKLEHEEAGGSDVSSVPGSVHDSADDESDLSDVPADYEDDGPPALLFPNLRRSADVGPVSDQEESGGESSVEEAEEAEDGEDGEEVEEAEEAEEASSPPADVAEERSGSRSPPAEEENAH